MKWTNLGVSAATAAAASVAVVVLADQPPNPNPMFVKRKAKDGSVIEVKECLKGTAQFPWREDCDNKRTIITNPETGGEEYAELDMTTGRLKPSGCLVEDESCSPEKMGIPESEKPDDEEIRWICGTACRMPKNVPLNRAIKAARDEKRRRQREKAKAEGEDGRRRDQVETDTKLHTTLNNLVLLLRFKDHKNRCVPSKQEIEVLFNKIEGDESIAPTGSVRDCFRYNSYNQFDMISTVCDWCDLPHTEAYYGDEYYAMTGLLTDAIHLCLDECQKTVNFAKFDYNKDKVLDAIAVLHSGYGSEWGGNDCETDNDFMNRVWSHKWEMTKPWFSRGGIEVLNYHISPAVWGTCGCNFGRIGVICHETGHFFGLPDLYDGEGGSGLGTHGLMGNSWGFDGSQYFPPMMSAWSKVRLGWSDAEVVTVSGRYNIPAAHSSPKVLAVVNPMNKKEYFICENKRRYPKFEKHLPEEGLICYHIDEDAGYGTEGHPDQPGWEKTRGHYRVAVVQADGRHDMEKGANLGDADDYFRGGKVDYFGPEGVGRSTGKKPTVTSKFPNTDWYSQDQVKKSGIKFYNISPSKDTMTVDIEIPNGGSVGRPGDGRDRDFGVDDDEKQLSCGEKGDPCTAHNQCCTIPKHTCKLNKRTQKKQCQRKKKKKRKLLRHRKE